eukprot:PhF_6_TR25251/c0_g1_i1/m.34767
MLRRELDTLIAEDNDDDEPTPQRPSSSATKHSFPTHAKHSHEPGTQPPAAPKIPLWDQEDDVDMSVTQQLKAEAQRNLRTYYFHNVKEVHSPPRSLSPDLVELRAELDRTEHPSSYSQPTPSQSSLPQIAPNSKKLTAAHSNQYKLDLPPASLPAIASQSSSSSSLLRPLLRTPRTTITPRGAPTSPPSYFSLPTLRAQIA